MKSKLGILVATVVILGLLGRLQPAGAEGAKSMKKALLLSFLMPGAGQQYLGNQARARMMMVSEAGVWGTFACFRIQGQNREERYKEMARLFAGVHGERDDGYYKTLAAYISSEDYNIDVMREARFRFPDDRQRQLDYFQKHAYFGDDAWEWESSSKQVEFRDIRTASKESYRRAVLTTGFAVLNRVVSMVDVYLSFKLGKQGPSSLYQGLRLEPAPDGGFRVYLSTSFF